MTDGAGTNEANSQEIGDSTLLNEDAETVKEKTAELTGKATEGAKDFGDHVRDKVKSD